MNAALDTRKIDDFEQFLSAHFAPLVGYLRSRGASEHDAQDIAQDSMFKLTRYRGHPEHVLRVLLYRIATNGLCDAHRRRTSARGSQHMSFEASNLELPSELPQPEEHAHQHQELLRVRNAISQLPDRCREIYLMNRVDGMSYTDISRQCGISVKTVEKHISKALGNLRQLLSSFAGPGYDA